MSDTIINIGRQYGAAGLEIARTLGEKLAIPVYDKELINEAASRSGFSREFFEHRDEKKGFLNVQNIFGIGRSMGNSQTFINDNELFKIQSAVMREIAGNGPAIFVGRASNYVLRDFRCLDVFICAPLPERVKRITGRDSLSAAEAEALIAKTEKGRRDFYNFFTYGDWGCASDYDLCIDSSLLGIEGTADYIIDFGRRAGLINP